MFKVIILAFKPLIRPDVYKRQPISLANAAIYLYENKDLCIKLGKNGKKFVLDNFDRAEISKKFVNLINRL